MNIFTWIAAIVFFLQLPNPVFWLVVHPQIGFWRKRMRAAYITALAISWGGITLSLVLLRRLIFTAAHPSDLRVGIGLLLIAADIWLFERSRQDLGTSKLIGKAELSGTGEVVDRGIYARLRNPRYLGMIGSVLGACILAATPLMWIIAAIWLVLVLIVIAFEEHELKARLGSPYIEYCRRVPRFLPHFAFRRGLARAK